MTDPGLGNYLGEDTVSNFVLFIADSVRYDYLPDDIASTGISAKAISPSTWTASSLPSILTSTYPSQHKTWGFSGRLASKPYILDRSQAGIDVTNVWGGDYPDDEKPTLSLLNEERNTTLHKLTPPFVLVVHDHGGHPPYGLREDGFGEDVNQFFNRNAGNEPKIKTKYEEGIAQSGARFLSLRDELEESGLLNDTLLVYTSDHGEILGEYFGFYGHNAPLVPELVEVPIVFTGAELPAEGEIASLISPIDIVPTALTSMGLNTPERMVGRDLITENNSSRELRSEVWKTTRINRVAQYAATSLWDDRGGIVKHLGNTVQRINYGLGFHLYLEASSVISRANLIGNIIEVIRIYAPTHVEWNDTSNLNLAESSLAKTEFFRDGISDDIEVDKERLRRLGYLE